MIQSLDRTIFDMFKVYKSVKSLSAIFTRYEATIWCFITMITSQHYKTRQYTFCLLYSSPIRAFMTYDT